MCDRGQDRLKFAKQFLLCLIYYRTYTSQAFPSLISSTSSPTVCRRIGAMTKLMVGYFRMPERTVPLSAAEKTNSALPLMINGAKRPVQRPLIPSKHKMKYLGEKKRYTALHEKVQNIRRYSLQ